MKHTTLCLLTLAVLASPLAAQSRITINLYDAAGLRADHRQAMKQETSKILQQAGVELDWVECELAGQPLNQPECARPLSAGRLMLQLAPGANKKNAKATGMAIIQPGSSFFACLYPQRVKDLASDANWDFAELLGHAAAHEIGHLLLESNHHSPAGIMRARWETGDLRRLSHNGLVFLSGQLGSVLARFTPAQETTTNALSAR
ncbi:MAG: hypothetical protein J0L64_21070 [Acidobacteria bacterium]|nr:hypothetical protein [Acidobacteriota bacterium]